MSLKPIESVNRNSFMMTGNLSAGDFHHFSAVNAQPPAGTWVYLDRLDAILCAGTQARSGSDGQGILQLDPLFLDNSAPLTKFEESAGLVPSRMAVGEWDKSLNIQNIYGGQTPPDEIWGPLDPVDYEMVDPGATIFTDVNWDAGPSEAGIGGWSEGTGGDPAFSTFVFFETWGFAIRTARVRHTDSNLYIGLAQVSLVDGTATLLNSATRYAAIPRALFEAPAFQGDDFWFSEFQFVPDDDNVLATPKGRLFMWSTSLLPATAMDQDDEPTYSYMKVIEFNPFGISPTSGNPTRVHLRELVFTRINLIQRDALGNTTTSSGDWPSAGTPVVRGNFRMRFHPPSRTIITQCDTTALETQNNTGFVRHSVVPGLTQVETPTPLAEVETNKTITYRTRALGDIGEVIGGIDATWSIARRSTIGETFDTTTAPTSVFVQNPPIDADGAIVEGSLVFKLNGTPLTEGAANDFTVNLTTGEITFGTLQTPSATSGYTADYKHVTVSATPAHGSLLTETTETDEVGQTETRVQYPDNDDLVADFDRLTVSITDD